MDFNQINNELMDTEEFDALQEGQRPEYLDIDELFRAFDQQLGAPSVASREEDMSHMEHDEGAELDNLVSMCSGPFPTSPPRSPASPMTVDLISVNSDEYHGDVSIDNNDSEDPFSIHDAMETSSCYEADNEGMDVSFGSPGLPTDGWAQVKEEELEESPDLFSNVSSQTGLFEREDRDVSVSVLSDDGHDVDSESAVSSANESTLQQRGGSRSVGNENEEQENEMEEAGQEKSFTDGEDEEGEGEEEEAEVEGARRTPEPVPNIRDLYTVAQFTKDYWRDSWARHGFRLTFKPEFAHLVVDNHELYATAILDLAARLTAGQKEISMGVSIYVNGEQSEMFNIPCQKISKLTTNFLLNEINDRIQSARGVTPITRDMLNVELTFIDHRRGSGRPNTKDILMALKDCPDLFQNERRAIRRRKQKPNRRRRRRNRATNGLFLDEVEVSGDDDEEDDDEHITDEEEEEENVDSDEGTVRQTQNGSHSCPVYECQDGDVLDDSDDEDIQEEDTIVNSEDDEHMDSEAAKELRKSSVKGLLKENNVFSDCLATAFLQGKAYCDFRAKRCSEAVYTRYVRVNDSHPNRSVAQRQEARDLLIAAGISKRRNFTMKDVRKLQRHVLKSYQIVVMGAAFDTQPLFTGTFCGRDRVVGLLLDKDHFQHIIQLPRFMGTKFWCSLCNARNSCCKRHYRCPLKCPKCLSETCKTEIAAEEKVQCQTCKVEFNSKSCHDRHLERGRRNGKSRCEETKVCKKCNLFYYTDRGTTHFCGESYCRQCKCVKKANHRHTLAVSKPNENKKKPFRRIFFDLETYIVEENGRQVHRVCLAQALRCCPDCNDHIPESLDEARDLACDTCSPDGNRFFEFSNIDRGDEDVDVLKQFGDWLIHKRHKGFSVIAHNLKGFDGQLLLQYIITESARVPEPKNLILAGRKLNFLHICGVKFLDSFNYIHAALKKFSDAFDVPEIKKGEFPHKFVCPENFGYTGSIPDKHYYDYDRRTVAGKAEFDGFYDPLVESGYVFNFAEEIRDYCFSDVALLAAGMVKFEKAFKEETNVILFEETVTAAGAAIKTFQRNYLKPYSMVLDVDPSGSKINQSALAGRYLAYLHEWERYPYIQHKYNIGEFQTPSGHYVDGYIKDCPGYEGGLIIEINGCFHHAHSCSYDDNSVMRGGLRAKDIRARDARRLQELEAFCKVIVVWECEIREDARHNRYLAKYLESNMACGPIVMRECLYGGRTEPIRLKQDIPEDMTGYYVDFNSLYPTCMKFDEYPVGEPEYLHGSMFDCLLPIRDTDVFRGTCKGVISCMVLPPDQLFFPVLPYRSGGKLFFSLCRKCTDIAAESEETIVHETIPECPHLPEERAFYGTWTHIELSLAVEMGYQILKVYGAVSWRQWSQYYKCGPEVTHGLFSEYVDAFTKGKLEASGPPRWVENDEDLDRYIADVQQREGILLSKENIKKDETKKQMFKLLLNSLWGKFGQRVDVKKTFIVKTSNQFHRIFEDPHLQVCSTNKVGDTLVMVAENVSGAAEPLPTSAMPYAVFTTSHSRARLLRLLLTVKDPQETVLYMDTDSLIYMAKECPHPELMGDTLGQLKNELAPGARMEKWVTTGPKSYAIQQRLPDGTEKVEVKCKGFPKTGQSEQALTVDLMERMVTRVLDGESGVYAEVKYFSIQRDRDHVLYNKEISKKFSFTFNKRIIMKDGGTFPLGYKAL